MSRQIKGKKKGIKSYNLTLKDLAKMSDRERHRYYSMLRAVAQKRLVRLAGAGLTDAAAYVNYRDDFVSLRAVNFSESDIAGLIMRAQQFLNDPGSTVRGYKQGVKDALEAIKEKHPVEMREVIKRDAEGNIMYQKTLNKKGEEVYKYQYVTDPLTGKKHRKRIPLTELKMAGEYDWITEEADPIEIFKMINEVKRIAGADIRYRSEEMQELWSVYKQQRNKDFDTNKRLQQALAVFRASDYYVTVRPTDQRIIKNINDIIADTKNLRKKNSSKVNPNAKKKRRKKK